MKLKLFWRKTNRGLWLGAVLLVALVIFIVASEVRFGFEKKKIRSTAKEFAKELIFVNLAEGEPGDGGYLTAAQKAKQSQALDAVVRKYGYSGKVSLNSGMQDLSGLATILAKRQTEIPAAITDIACRTEDWDVRITSRSGTGRATVVVTTDDMKISGKGMAAKDNLLFPLSNAATGEVSEEWSSLCQITFTLEFVRRGGKWLIAGMTATDGSYYYYDYN